MLLMLLYLHHHISCGGVCWLFMPGYLQHLKCNHYPVNGLLLGKCTSVSRVLDSQFNAPGLRFPMEYSVTHRKLSICQNPDPNPGKVGLLDANSNDSKKDKRLCGFTCTCSRQGSVSVGSQRSYLYLKLVLSEGV